MSGDIPNRVTCEVCGTAFDPSESRGWCPNEACGRWQHPAFPLSDTTAATEADGGVDAPTKVCPNCGKDVRVDANFCKFCSHEFEEEAVEPAEPAGTEPGLDQCPDCGADLSSIPPDRLDDCPICGTNLADVLAERSEPTVTPADLPACPACGEDLTDIPSDMRMVCPGCRVDLRDAIEEHDIRSPDDVSPAPEPSPADQPSEAAANVDTVKGIGSSYAERLTEVGVETVGDLVTADTGELAAMTDISEKRIDEWKERAPVDSAALGGGAAGQAASETSEATRGGGTGGETAQRGGGPGGQQGQPGAGAEASNARSGGETTGQQGGQGRGQQGGQGRGQQGGQGRGQQGGQGRGQQGGQGRGQEGGQGRGQQGGQQGGQGRGQQGGQGRGQQGGQGRGQQGGQGRGQEGGQGRGQQGGQGRGQEGGQGRGAGQAGGTGYGRPGRDAQPSYDTVVLEVMGQDIRAQPGDTLGREIRTAMVEGGAPDEDAVYVHREHVRVEREGDSFYLERLGQNSLKVNGEPVGQHDRAEITNGDVVSFSEVVTADVRLE